MTDVLSVSIQDGVADVRLNRPDKMNAINNELFDALIDTAAMLDSERSVRAVVMSGEGRAFCAGLDMSLFAAMANADSSEGKLERLTDRTHGIANRPQQAVWGWRSLRVPVIAAVHGAALGGGFQIMLGSDMRLVHPETKLSILEIKWGLVPDMAGTPIMRALARDDVLRELTYTGRVFSGEEAKEYGFATHLSETPRERALELAAEIVAKSPDAVQAAKALLNTVSHDDAATLLLRESELQEPLIGSPNQLEAIAAGMEGRVGNFRD